ncbi:Metallo-dependent hydrolase [Gautieria morchelliformis]|nr:Metallo-dependent hydrolase [Gautieria morchelliformis]
MNDLVAEAFNSLSKAQAQFLRNLPKAELHAHLNGSIPLSCLQELARESNINSETLSETVSKGLEVFERGVELNVIDDFFSLFPAIYALTSTVPALATVTREVLSHFLAPGSDGTPSQCQYMELRTTPRKTNHMMRGEYLDTVLNEVEKYSPETAALLISIDRRMSLQDVQECVDLAISLKEQGRRVVGIDLCGDPLIGDMATFLPYFERAKVAGLKITLHIAETPANTEEDTQTLLSSGPSRLGHATFLSTAARDIVLRERIPIEICLTSNLLCKTVKTIDAHHIRYYLEHNHPIAICTDDILPFRNSLVGEYALLMAAPPLGLGLSDDDIRKIAHMSFLSSFKGGQVATHMN